MNVVVTGGLGGLGSWVVESYAADGHQVTSLDVRTPDAERENVDFRAVELTDYGETAQLIREVDPDGVIHLAAYPHPLDHAGVRVFENNTLTTYNVLDAAGSVGSDVVWASSESIYGTVFPQEPWVPEALPIDEETPIEPEDPYGLSKVAGEEIAKTTTRRYGIDVASIRPSWINFPGEYFVADERAGFDPDDPEPSGNFWSYVDVRDVVSAFRAALEADIDGHEAYLIAAENNYLGHDTAEAVEAAFGQLPAECAIEDEQSALDTQKAREQLDWAPEHTWRTAESESVPGPSFI